MKRRRVDQEIDARKDEEDLAFMRQLSMTKSSSGLGLVIDEPVEQIGTDTRYEVVKKKSENVLVAKRCSRRHTKNMKKSAPID